MSNLLDKIRNKNYKTEDLIDEVETVEELVDSKLSGDSTLSKKSEDFDDREEFLDWVLEKTIDEFTTTSVNYLNNYDKGIITKKDVMKRVMLFIRGSINDSKYGKLTKEETERIYDRFDKFIWGYDILDEFIENEDISDIALLSYNNIELKARGHRYKAVAKFPSKDYYNKFIERTVIKNKSLLSEIDAIQHLSDDEVSDKFKLRITVSSGVVGTGGKMYLSIRKIPKFKYGFDRLIEDGMLTEEVKEYIIDRIKKGHSFLISGHGGSGKTILMNEMIEQIPYDQRFDAIQNVDELFSNNHPNIMFHSTLEPKGENKVGYDLSVLGRSGLKEDLDGFIIGEIVGSEAMCMGTMANTGHICWASLHSRNARESLYVMADYATMGTGINIQDYLPRIAGIDTLIHMSHYKIDEIVEVENFDRESQKFTFKDIDIKTAREVGGEE